MPKDLEYRLNQKVTAVAPVYSHGEDHLPNIKPPGYTHLSEEEWKKHSIATFIGDRNLFLDLTTEQTRYVFSHLPEDF